MSSTGIQDEGVLRSFCERWKVRELSVFGSAANGGLRPDSDVDLLVTFAPDAAYGLLDHARMERELAALLGRPVDLVTRASVEQSHNPIRREAIISTTRTIYHAA